LRARVGSAILPTFLIIVGLILWQVLRSRAADAPAGGSHQTPGPSDVPRIPQPVAKYPAAQEASTPSTDRSAKNRPGASVSGCVLDDATGKPAADCTILFISFSLDRTLQGEGVTDAEGRFAIGPVPDGYYHPQVRGRNLVLVGQPVSVQILEAKDVSGIELRVGPGAIVSGRVYDARTGRGISGVAVTASPDEWSWDRLGTLTCDATDSSGRYRIDGLAPVAHRVCAVPTAGYVDSDFREAGAVSRGRLLAPLRPGQEAVGIDLALEPGLTVSGRVVDQQGRPVPEAHIAGHVRNVWHVNAPSARTDADGAFSFVTTCPPGGELMLQAHSTDLVGEPEGPFTVTSTGLRNVRLTVYPPASIAGTVVDARGDPVAHAKLHANPKRQEGLYHVEAGRADEDGAFEIASLPEDTYSLRAELISGSDNPTLEIAVARGQRRTGVRLICNDGPSFTIRGRVTNTRGEPIHGAHVTARRGAGAYDDPQRQDVSASAQTGPDGAYRIQGLPDGQYRLSASHIDYQESERWVESLDGEEVDFTLEKLKRGVIEGQVVRADNAAPITDFRIEVRKRSTYYYDDDYGLWVYPDAMQTITSGRFHDAEGRFRFGRVRTGAVEVHATAAGFTPGVQKVDVVPEEEGVTEVLIALEPALRVEGLVLSDSGVPLSGALIFIGEPPRVDHIDRQKAPVAASLRDGTFVLDSLSTDPQVISGTLPHHAPGSVEVVPSRTHVTRIEIVLQELGAVEGTVRVAGRPFPEATVGCPGAREAHTLPNGTYRIADVKPGEVDVVACAPVPTASGTVSRKLSKPALIVGGQTTVVDFDFRPEAGVIEGVVTLGGHPARRGHVSLHLDTPSGVERRGANPDEGSGGYRFEGLPAGAGTLWVSASPDGETFLRRTLSVELALGQSLRRDIEFAGTGIVAGEIVGASRDANMRIRLLAGHISLDGYTPETFSEFPPPAVATTSKTAHGFFRLTAIDAGDYTVVAHTNEWIAYQYIRVGQDAETFVTLEAL